MKEMKENEKYGYLFAAYSLIAVSIGSIIREIAEPYIDIPVLLKIDNQILLVVAIGVIGFVIGYILKSRNIYINTK